MREMAGRGRYRAWNGQKRRNHKLS
ncbi:hypothetical protein [Agrobacterium tumefaciens]